MGYETAPATLMLATNCAACGRPLVDAASVDANMGPDCRVKYGVTSLDDDTRSRANAIIYQIALQQEGPEVVQHIGALREMGLKALADRIVKRLAVGYAAVIDVTEQEITLKTSYETSQSINFRAIPGRFWDKARKVNAFPLNSKRALFQELQRSLRGARCLGPKGEFTL